MNRIDEIVKEFYAQYGHVMHEIQVLENGLLEYYAITEYLDKKLSNIEYYRILSNPKRLTLGQLLKLLNVKGLAHKFWWEKSIDFDNNESLVQLHREFTMYLNLFELLIGHFHNLTISLRTKNDLHIEEEMELTDFKKRDDFIRSLKK
jgi:hypothetical protein